MESVRGLLDDRKEELKIKGMKWLVRLEVYVWSAFFSSYRPPQSGSPGEKRVGTRGDAGTRGEHVSKR